MAKNNLKVPDKPESRQNSLESDQTWEYFLFFISIFRYIIFTKKLKILAISAAFLAALLAGSSILPEKYEIQSRILTRQTSNFSSLTQRYPRQISDYTRIPIELMLSNESIMYVIEKGNLRDRWKETRTIAGIARDYLIESLSINPINTHEDPLINTIRSRISAHAEGETIVLQTEWHTPEDCKKISDLIIDFMINKIHHSESDDGKITIQKLNESHADARQKLDTAIANLTSHYSKKRHLDSQRFSTEKIRESSMEVKLIEEGIAKTEESLINTRQQIADLTNQHIGEIAEFEYRLKQINSTLGPNHPDYRAATRQLMEKNRMPKIVDNLKNKELELNQILTFEKANLARLTNKRSQEIEQLIEQPGNQHDPEAELMIRHVQNLISRYNETKENLEDVSTTIGSHLASLPSRFTLTVPPRIPSKSSSTPKTILYLCSTILSPILAIGLLIIIELWSSTVVDPWQIKEITGATCIATLRQLKDTR